MFGIVDTASTYSPAKTVEDGLRSNSLTNTFSLSKEEKYVPEGSTNDYYNSSLFTDEDIVGLERSYGISVDPVLQGRNGSYFQNENVLDFTNNPLFSNSNYYGILSLDDERRSELGFSMIAGEYPKEDDEIAISDYIYCCFKEVGYRSAYYIEEAEELKPEDIRPETLIGKELTLENDSFTITGILNTGFGIDPSRTVYAELNQVSQNDIYQDSHFLNLSNQLRFNVQENYGNCLYVSKSCFDVLNNNNGFYNENDFSMNEGTIVNSFAFNDNDFRFNFNDFAPQSNVTFKTHFTESGKTTLDSNELLVSKNKYEELLQWYISKNALPLREEDKTATYWYLDSTYSDEGYQNGWQLTSSETDNGCETVDQLTMPDSWIMDYAKENLPETEEFKRYVKEFYRYLVGYYDFDEETGIENYIEEWRDFPESRITEDFRAYAYLRAINSPYDVVNSEIGKFSQNTTTLFQSYLDDYDLQMRQNVFGGKTFDDLNKEWQESLYRKYAPDSLVLKGYFQYVSYYEQEAPAEQEFRIIGYFEPNEEDRHDYSNYVILSDDLFQDFAPYLNLGFQNVLLSSGESVDTIVPLIQSSYDESSETRYVLNNAVSYSISSFNSLIQMVSGVLFYVALGMAIFSALLLMNFISVSISYKKREIGILRAVGAKASDVFKIFFSEAFVIAVINFVIAAIGAGIGSYFFNGMVVEAIGSLGSFFIFGIRQVAIMLAISVGIAFVASFLPVYLVARKRPVEAIRSN